MTTPRRIQISTAAAIGTIVAALLIAPSATPAALAGTCIRATVDEPVVLPDGTSHDPGEIRVCATRAYSPVATLHTIAVAGDALGVFLGRRAKSESAPDGVDAVMVFGRGRAAGLQLIGVGLRTSDRLDIHWFGWHAGGPSSTLGDSVLPAPLASPPASGDGVLVVAAKRY